MCALLALSLLFIFVFVSILSRVRSKEKCVYIVTLGDIGRSPRMQFHALSLARAGFDVCIYGYGGSEPYSDVASSAAIHLINLSSFPAVFQKLPRLAVFVLKVVWQTVTLLLALMTGRRPSHILLQNPPSLPTITVCWLVSRLHGCQFVIDWHNYGYTVLALELRQSHPLVIIHRWYERLFGQFSDSNICVTNAMRRDLMTNWNISRVVTMHDRPGPMFTDLSVEDQHKLCCKLDIFREATLPEGCVEITTRTVKDAGGSVSYRDDRPAVLVSGTSWTEDEDFSVLLHALDIYDKRSTAESDLPRLICVITGKGPLKEHYRQLVTTRSWTRVKVHMPWLESADYPRMLASADLGVCLHKSSSGLDLPMKVVDMFGCRLPVCAINFACLSELVEHDKNGTVFNNESELADQLQDLLRGFPDRCDTLRRYRENLRSFQRLRWQEAWTDIVLPLFTQ